MTTIPQELKPCPFCGAENVVESYTSTQPFKIQCECDVGPMISGKTSEQCIEKWNTRCAAEPVDAGELDAAIEYLSKYENGWSGPYGCAVEMVYHAAKAHRASPSNIPVDQRIDRLPSKQEIAGSNPAGNASLSSVTPKQESSIWGQLGNCQKCGCEIYGNYLCGQCQDDEETQSFWHEPPKGGIVEVVIDWNERQYNVQSFSKSAWKHKHNPTAQAKGEV